MSQWNPWNGEHSLPHDVASADRVFVINSDGSETGPHTAHYVEWGRVRNYRKAIV
jgi:hypothetical protein